MHIIKNLARLGALSAILGAVAAAFAGPALASTALIPRPGGPDDTLSQPTVVRTVVVGGMPGWQIALIAIVAAIAAAVVAAVAAVLVDRARSARRQPLSSPA